MLRIKDNVDLKELEKFGFCETKNTFLKNGISIIKEIDYIKDIKNKKIYDESINIINNIKDEKLILYFEYENYRWNYFISNEYKDVYYGKTCFDYNILIELIKHIKTFNDIEIDNNDCYLENDKYQIIIKNNTYKNNEIIKEMITIEKTTLIKKIMKIKNIIPISSGILCGIFIVIFVFFIL